MPCFGRIGQGSRTTGRPQPNCKFRNEGSVTKMSLLLDSRGDLVYCKKYFNGIGQRLNNI